MPDIAPLSAAPDHSRDGQKTGELACRILVADDQADLVAGLARILKGRGYEVLQAIGGRQAVEIAGVERPLVLLLDISMPDLDGIQACREIRRTCPEAFFIFMTGFSEFEQQAKDEGAVAVLRKPVDYPKLFEILEGLRPL